MDIKRLDGESITDWRFRVLLAKSKKEIDNSWKEIHEELETGLSIDTVTKGTIFFPELEKYIVSKYKLTEDELPKYKETVEIHKDGVQKSDKLIQLSHEEMKDEKSLLLAHNYNPDVWEITSAKNSIYDVNAKGGITKTLYSSRISVKKKENSFDVDKLVEKLKDGIKVSELNYSNLNSENMLVIPYFDMHFGIATLDTYKEVLNKTINRIKSKKWDKILIIFGQDALHNDNFSGSTSSGTIIDKVDMEKAWSDLHSFYTVVFDESIQNSNSVDAIYSNGNHDKSMGWAFAKLLEYQYPQVKFDNEMKQFKGYLWNNIFIGTTHGDKASNRIFETFLAEYGKLIANAETKEILSGHIHHQKTIDKYGLVHKTLGTGVPSDEYHQSNGFVGSQKQFQMLEYNKNYPEAVYYV